MIQIQGVNENTQLRHSLRQIRASFMANVRAGRCAMNKRVLAEFDANLKALDDKAKTQAHARQR